MRTCSLLSPNPVTVASSPLRTLSAVQRVSEVMRLIERQVGYRWFSTDAHPETEWISQHSPETFSAIELEVSLDACHTAMSAWAPAGRWFSI